MQYVRGNEIKSFLTETFAMSDAVGALKKKKKYPFYVINEL